MEVVSSEFTYIPSEMAQKHSEKTHSVPNEFMIVFQGPHATDGPNIPSKYKSKVTFPWKTAAW